MAVRDEPEPDGPHEYKPDRFVFRTDHSGGDIVVRPNEFLTTAPDERVRDAFIEIISEVNGVERFELDERQLIVVGRPIRGVWRRYRTGIDIDVIRVVRGLRERGIPAQPNHVYFVTTLPMSSASQFAPNMFAPNMFAPNMFAPNMFAPNMFAPNMFAPNMFAPNMFAGGGGGGCCCPGGLGDAGTRQVPVLAARPASPPLQPPTAAVADQHVQIHVIDVATPGDDDPRDHCAGELEDENHLTDDAIDENGDGWVDPALGHGDFVKSIIELNSGLDVTLWQAADPLGDIDDVALVSALDTVDQAAKEQTKIDLKIVNLSLSGYNEDDRPSLILADQIKSMIADGWVIVASAGNNASCRLAWPAALPDVVAVGAFGACGPAWFSNYGPWVDASGPGVNVVAGYPDLTPLGGRKVAVVDDETVSGGKRTITTDDFSTGWVTWSGTSFSAPFVTARLASVMQSAATDGFARADAIEKALHDIVRSPELPRLPYYGTLVT